jgi:hypothetical protein
MWAVSKAEIFDPNGTRASFAADSWRRQNLRLSLVAIRRYNPPL